MAVRMIVPAIVSMAVVMAVIVVMIMVIMASVVMFVRVIVTSAHLRRDNPVASLEFLSLPVAVLTINSK